MYTHQHRANRQLPRHRVETDLLGRGDLLHRRRNGCDRRHGARARAMTAPLVAKAHRPLRRSAIGRASLSSPLKRRGSPAGAKTLPPIQTAAPYRLASADPNFAVALSALAMKPPADIAAEEEHSRAAVPGQDNAHPSSRRSPNAPGAIRTPAAPLSPATADAPIVMPQITDLLPRPRPPLTPGAGARSRRQGAREGGEVPRQRDLFRSAQRAGARPDRGRAGRAQPRVLALLSGRRLRRGLSERAPPAGLPVHLRLRRHSRRRSARRGRGSARRRSPSRRSTSQDWLPDVAKSTHYHATYVRPRWIREMKRMVKHGQHIFYRPHRWGDGEDEAGWGVASLTHSAADKTKTAKN